MSISTTRQRASASTLPVTSLIARVALKSQHNALTASMDIYSTNVKANVFTIGDAKSMGAKHAMIQRNAIYVKLASGSIVSRIYALMPPAWYKTARSARLRDLQYATPAIKVSC